MKFITTLAWVFGSLSSLLLILRIVGFFAYSDIEKLCDNIQGKEKTFPVIFPGMIAIICWIWIISN